MLRIKELDAIRGLAALSILLFHLAPATPYLTYGWSAVDCFFVLSSYLVTSILIHQREQKNFFFNFYARRSLRIWPIYYLTLLILVAVNQMLLVPEAVDGLPYYATYTQNVPEYFGASSPPFIRCFVHTWTLAIEEQFYLIWPLFVYLCSRRSLLVVSALAFVGSIAAREGLHLPSNLLVTRCEGFALGSILAIVLGRLSPEAQRIRGAITFSMLLVIVMGLILANQSHPFFKDASTFIFPASCVAYASIIGLVVCRRGDRWLGFLRISPLLYLGTISYGAYLYHVPLDRGLEIVFRRVGIQHRLDVGYPLWRTILELALSLAMASASWHFLEKPVLKLKRFFEYRNPNPKTTPNQARDRVISAPATSAQPLGLAQ